VGLAQSVGLTLRTTGSPDPYEDIALYEPLRQLFGNTLDVGFQTDLESKKKTHSRFWRAQFAATPTILRITYSNAESLAVIRKNIEARGFDFLIYEYTKKGNFQRFEKDLLDLSTEHQCELTTHPVAKKVVVFEIGKCRHE
jgi:hypothetical protein